MVDILISPLLEWLPFGCDQILSGTLIPLEFSLPDVNITEAGLVLLAKALPSILATSLITTSEVTRST